MANTYGMYSLNDLLAVRNASAASFGLDEIARTIQAEVAYANDRVNEMLADFAQPFTSQSAIWGGGGLVTMEKSDEYGVPLLSHSAPGITAQFPLSLFRQSIGWTEEYFEKASPAEVAEKYLELRKGYFAAITKEMARALYGYGVGTAGHAEYTFVDRLTNGVSLSINGFAQGDVVVGTIPDSPAGATFATTHTHLLAENTVTNADVDAMVTMVTEHGNTKGLKIFLNAADKAAFVALTEFTALSSPLLVYAGITSTLDKLDNGDLENQKIGYWNNYIPCYVKPWAVDNYLLCVATDMPEKALGYRTDGPWKIAATYSDYPLIAEYAKAKFGFAVWNRTMGAVDYMNSDTWATPTALA